MSDWQPKSDWASQTRDGYAAQQIREAIKRGYFEPGQKLEENELANLFSVSRSPIREALRTLAAEGLVNVVPHRGAMVAELTVDELREVYLIRASLEGLAASLGVPRIDDQRLERLGAVLEELDEATEQDTWIRLNREFHHIIYRAVDYPRLLALIQRYRDIAAPYLRRYIASPEHLKATQVGHHRIYEACKMRDAKTAQEATVEHLRLLGDKAVEFVESERPSPEEV